MWSTTLKRKVSKDGGFLARAPAVQQNVGQRSVTREGPEGKGQEIRIKIIIAVESCICRIKNRNENMVVHGKIM